MLSDQVIVVDNFFEAVDKVRDFALAQKYHKENVFPGVRTVESFFYDELKQKIEDILGCTVISANSRNGCYQAIFEDDFKKSYVHSDATKWAGVVYLSNSIDGTPGTSFFAHKKTKKTYFEDYLSHHYSKDRFDLNKWNTMSTIEFKLNRLVMYSGKTFHMNASAWGNSVENARLTQVFFLN